MVFILLDSKKMPFWLYLRGLQRRRRFRVVTTATNVVREIVHRAGDRGTERGGHGAVARARLCEVCGDAMRENATARDDGDRVVVHGVAHGRVVAFAARRVRERARGCGA